jgi:hypothetical protein
MKNNLIIGFVLGVVLTMIVISSVWGIGKQGKYEKVTAEGWFYNYTQVDEKYKKLFNCVGKYVGNVENNVSGNDLWKDCLEMATIN